jgi:hypothetical protein
MLRFRKAINHLEVKEIPLRGRKYTWSNGQNPPTITRIERAFCTPTWEEVYPLATLQPQSSSSSDHCPLLLTPLFIPRAQPKFRIESHWPHMPGFIDVVEEAWNKEVPQQLSYLVALHVKLNRTVKSLKSWSKYLLPHAKLAMMICREVISGCSPRDETFIL